MIRDVKRKTTEDYFRSDESTADEGLPTHTTDAPCPAFPKVSNLGRQTNRKRLKTKPSDPKDRNAEIDTCHFRENFLNTHVELGVLRLSITKFFQEQL